VSEWVGERERSGKFEIREWKVREWKVREW
jgi:hypothetical protein